jgi:hypothetical protein
MKGKYGDTLSKGFDGISDYQFWKDQPGWAKDAACETEMRARENKGTQPPPTRPSSGIRLRIAPRSNARITLPSRLNAVGNAAAPVLGPMAAETAGYMVNDWTHGQFRDEMGNPIGIMDRTIGSSPAHMLDNVFRTFGADPYFFRTNVSWFD